MPELRKLLMLIIQLPSPQSPIPGIPAGGFNLQSLPVNIKMTKIIRITPTAENGA